MGKEARAARVVGAPQGGVTVTIAREVLEDIVLIEATRTDGVVPSLGAAARGSRRHRARGLQVKVSGQEVKVHVTVGVRGGLQIPQVARKLRERIVAAVRAKTGYTVQTVDVFVDHLAFEGGPS